MIRMEDHRKETGEIDWDAYKKAQKAAGEICTSCEAYITSLNSTNSPTRCYECRELQSSKGEVRHKLFVRCPKCTMVRKIDHCDDSIDLYKDEAELSCYHCDNMIHVQLYVTVDIISPPLELHSKVTETTEEEEE